MRFRILLEATAPEATINTFLQYKDHNTPQAKEDLIEAAKEVIASIAGTSNGLFAYLNSTVDNAIKLCLALQKLIGRIGNDKSQKVIQLLSNVQVAKISSPDCFINFVALGQAYEQGQINLSEEFLKNPSLYSRGTLDFSYALKVLKVASNPTELSKYYGNSDQVKYEDLFVGKDIKPSGAVDKNPKDISTIYGTVELWKVASGKGSSKQSSKSEYPEFKNFEDAQKSGATMIKINGLFKYNKDDNKWEPVNS